MLNFRHPVVRFLQKTMGLVQIKVTISNYDFGLDYKLHEPKLHRSPPSDCILYWKFFHRSRFWVTCACPEKTELPWKFSLSWICFLHSRFLTTCACPENRVCPENLHCIEYTFHHSGFLINFALALKNRVALNSLHWIYIFTSRSFEPLAIALKNRVRPEIFHCIKYSFYIQDFCATCACP